MEVTSVNVGTTERLDGNSFSGETGICKRPVSGPVPVGQLGLKHDAILHKQHHGGPDQAVYLYRSEDYDWWSGALERTIEAGTFGENLTLSGLPEANLRIGSRLLFDDLELEVTAPRIPCNILAERMGDPRFAKQFIKAERPGIYCRVLREGSVRAGETFSLTQDDGSGVSTLDMFRGAYRKLDRAELESFLAAPIDVRSRADYEAQLAKLMAS